MVGMNGTMLDLIARNKIDINNDLEDSSCCYEPFIYDDKEKKISLDRENGWDNKQVNVL